MVYRGIADDGAAMGSFEKSVGAATDYSCLLAEAQAVDLEERLASMFGIWFFWVWACRGARRR
ncbi:hypothetical protein CFP75_31690 [Amycolatopsis alba DSM 44262]|uniref:Uncharacterized protein n=1 Tax=Amycolatopsis alba DSM 44262 TaxID=1125972 RepID=A0A229RES9_AMYAL|nr:hypothetical protein CFP75_31690 [Amycolatopsis alba DSM 44262]